MKFPISDDLSTVHPGCIRCWTMKRNGNGKGQVTRGSPHIDILMGTILTEKIGYLSLFHPIDEMIEMMKWWNDETFHLPFYCGKLSQMMTDSSALLGSRLNPDPRKTRLVWREIFGGIVTPSFWRLLLFFFFSCQFRSNFGHPDLRKPSFGAPLERSMGHIRPCRLNHCYI